MTLLIFSFVLSPAVPFLNAKKARNEKELLLWDIGYLVVVGVIIGFWAGIEYQIIEDECSWEMAPFVGLVTVYGYMFFTPGKYSDNVVWNYGESKSVKQQGMVSAMRGKRIYTITGGIFPRIR